MAQPLQSINLVAPAFKGVNTEDSPIAQDPSYADVADNAVIDKRGRIAARKGIDVVVDKTSVAACSERTSAPKETSLESNIYPPHTRTLHSWKIDHHQCQYHH